MDLSASRLMDTALLYCDLSDVSQRCLHTMNGSIKLMQAFLMRHSIGPKDYR